MQTIEEELAQFKYLYTHKKGIEFMGWWGGKSQNQGKQSKQANKPNNKQSKVSSPKTNKVQERSFK